MEMEMNWKAAYKWALYNPGKSLYTRGQAAIQHWIPGTFDPSDGIVLQWLYDEYYHMCLDALKKTIVAKHTLSLSFLIWKSESQHGSAINLLIFLCGIM